MTATPINQDTINAAVWAACDTFRGTVDPSIYKDYVLTMLFRLKVHLRRLAGPLRAVQDQTW